MQKKSSVFKFLLPYIIILGVIIGLFVLVGNGTTQSVNLEAQSYKALVDTQIKDGYLVSDYKKADDPSDDVYYKITFKTLEVEEGSTVTGFSGTFDLVKDANPVIEDTTYIFQAGNLGNKDKVTCSFSFIVSNNDPLLIKTYSASEDLSEFGVYYETRNAANSNLGLTLIINFLPIILIGVVAFLLYRSFSKQGGGAGGAGGAFDFGKSTAKEKKDVHVKFNDVAGCEEEKQEMQELVEYLKSPKKFTDMGARIPKGFLLTGQPGTGKTLLAKAVAGEAGVPFYFISGSDFVEMFVGVGASRVRDMFKKAKEHAPSMIFIDEIDAVGRQRGTGLGGGHDEREQTLNQLLVELDGFGENSGVIVIAATNRPDVLDPALLRPGRFDRQIMVGLPDKNGREAILKVHARNKKVSSEVDFSNIASRTPGFSGAQLENVLNEAAILSVRENHEKISATDIDEAIDRVMAGPAKKTKVISERCKRMVAYHEAGHAVVGLKVADAETVQKITIIPRGDAGGYVLMTPKDDGYLQTKGELKAKITSYLAGRASEEIFFEDITTGAVSDIESATNIARAMVTYLGMSDLGPIKYESSSSEVFLGRDYGAGKGISGEVANAIDKAVKNIIEECLTLAKNTIEENKDLLVLIAEALLKYETITSDEINFLVKYGSLDAYDAYKKQSELLAKASSQENTTTTEEVKEENNEVKGNETDHE